MNQRLSAQKEKVPEPFRFCQHVVAKRISAPKRCMLNHECFHCAYDQWLDAIDLEKIHPGLTAESSKSNLTKAA